MKEVVVTKGAWFGVETYPRKMNLYMDRCSGCQKDLPNYPHCNYCPNCGSKLIYNDKRNWQ